MEEWRGEEIRSGGGGRECLTRSEERGKKKKEKTGNKKRKFQREKVGGRERESIGVKLVFKKLISKN